MWSNEHFSEFGEDGSLEECVGIARTRKVKKKNKNKKNIRKKGGEKVKKRNWGRKLSRIEGGRGQEGGGNAWKSRRKGCWCYPTFRVSYFFSLEAA